MFSRVVVLGAGALGNVLGGHLARVLPVVLIGREKHVAAVRARGLEIGGRESATIPPGRHLTAVTTPANLTPSLAGTDALLLTVKAAQAAEAAREAAAAFDADRPAPAVFSLLNGTGYEDDLRQALAPRVAPEAVVAHRGAVLVAPGRVEDWGGFMVCPATPTGRALAKLLERAGVEVRTTARLETERWKKIAFNCALNPAAALLGVRNREALPEKLRPWRRAVLREAAAAAATVLDEEDRAAFPAADELSAEFERLARASNNVNSMLQDLRRGRPTERAFLNEAIVARAAAAGREAPANALAAQLVRRLEEAGNAEEARVALVRELYAAAPRFA